MPRRSIPPNVVVFFTDQQRWDTTGVHGNPSGLTPNFDRLAAAGTHLFHSFTCQPVCLPARSCLQTGRYATQTGCITNHHPLPPATRTLAHHYNRAGYRTGYIGKWHLAGEQVVSPKNRGGYREWLAANVLEFSSDAYRCVLYDERGRAVRLPGYRVDAQTDAAIRFVDRHRARPFFLFCSYLEPHFQNDRDDYPAPDVYRDTYLDPWTPPDLRALGGSSARHLPGYYGMVRRLDESLGRLLDALKSLDLADRTIVLFTSDHGCHFKTRNPEYKRSCHESSIRVPTALIGPGFTGGGRVTELVSLIDLPPTLLDACGLPVPGQMMGRSVLPLTRGQRRNWPDDVYVQISEDVVGRAVRTRRWKYGVVAPDGDPGSDLVAEHYEEAFLYDLLADPYELNNLIGWRSHTGVAKVLRQRLRRRLRETGEPAAVISPAPARPSPMRPVKSAEARQ
ncbi:sulfatase-like hydrolase/transferase [bacterium]|nr:sulfatase-like hydrolase/transferase [bacterium]